MSATADASFESLGLDARLLQAVVRQKFERPTLVQAQAIPLVLDGQDVLAKSKTGSGKTAAYLLPILQSILRRKMPLRSVAALILVPTRELAEQVFKVLEAFTAFCAKDVRAVNLTQKVSDAVQRALLADKPDIVIATPARAASNVASAAMSLAELKHLVIDEADLIMSYGYDEDLKNMAKHIPQGVQMLLTSATLSSDVDAVRALFGREPVVLDLQEPEDEGEGIAQFVVKCGEDEKFLLLYVIFKLKLIKGKCIIFVGDIDRCYRLKLYLEQFTIKSCILNSELPVNTRIHTVDEFNKNVYDIIIATDEHEVLGDEDNKKSKDKEFGISRGIDFKNVACVLNFDLPTNSKSYTHRIGRTGRAGQTGMALSFVVPESLYRKHKALTMPSTKHDDEVLEKIVRKQKKHGKEVKPYDFDMKQLEPFRYRMEDAIKSVTRAAIREARVRELRQELINSEKLKRHFEENPKDLYHLRHDGELRPAKVKAHLKHVPDYLLPTEGKKAIKDVGYVGIRKSTDNRIRKARLKKGRGKVDPLKSFKARKRV